MSCSRTSRPAALLPLFCLIATVLAGCQDDLPPPTQAQVELAFQPFLPVGGEVYIDGELAFRAEEGSARDRFGLLLAQGSHEIAIRQDCVRIEPSDTLSIDVAAGHPMSVAFQVIETSAMLVVSSNPPGLPVTLDGEPTGRTTPAEFLCLEAGDYEVIVDPEDPIGFSLTGERTKIVTLGSSGQVPVHFDFQAEPLAQERGVLVELFTATFCPNCGPAEEALKEIEFTPAPPLDQISTVEVHLVWGGSDPFYTSEIGALRVTYYYGNDAQSAPRCYFNGTDLMEGVPDPEQIRETYDARIQSHYGGAADVSLYWSNARLEGSMLRGDLRCVAVEDLSSLGPLDLYAFYTKDSLWTRQYPNQMNDFYGVARDYLDAPLDLAAEGVAVRASYLDRSVAFDLSADPSWPSPSVRLSAFVQRRDTREVLQVREVRLDLP